MYKKYFKRVVDFLCAVSFIIIFSWLYVIIAFLVRVKLGSPVIFKQIRPGKIDPATGKEKLFYAYKFRTMTDERDKNGELLPDEKRLTPFGNMLRSTSLDEFPQVFNILMGDMSFIGPRPHLVKDMVFMNRQQRKRHTVTPGLSGLAQINGRNNIGWRTKIDYDIYYVRHTGFIMDTALMIKTVIAVLRHDGINEEGMATHEYLGDYLLRIGKITQKEYDEKQLEAKKLIADFENKSR